MDQEMREIQHDLGLLKEGSRSPIIYEDAVLLTTL